MRSHKSKTSFGCSWLARTIFTLCLVLSCTITKVNAERISRLLNANEADLLRIESLQSTRLSELQENPSDGASELSVKMLELLKTFLLNKRLQQTSSYGGYQVMLPPFTSTDEYNYADAFFLGLKLSDWYDFSDTCLNNIFFMLDDVMYF